MRETVIFCQALVRLTLADPTSATTVPEAVRSRSLIWIGLPTDEAEAAFTQASAV